MKFTPTDRRMNHTMQVEVVEGKNMELLKLREIFSKCGTKIATNRP